MNKKSPWIRWISWSLVVMWMGVIFLFSAQVAKDSNALSTSVTEVVIDQMEKVLPQQAEISTQTMNHLLRKNAHFLIYLLLGGLLFNAWRRSGKEILKSFVLALLMGFIYAITDEVHQLFVPGRGAQVQDVLIDTMGVATGTILGTCIEKGRLLFTRREIIRRKNE